MMDININRKEERRAFLSVPEDWISYTSTGDANACFLGLTDDFKSAKSLGDKFNYLMVGTYSLNKFGYYYHAQTCAIRAYEIALSLEETPRIHRSRFAVLHSSRLANNVNLCSDYILEAQAVEEGEVQYLEANQSLVPSYAAFHLMEKKYDKNTIKRLLHDAGQFHRNNLSRLTHKLAWTRYYLLTGNLSKSKKILYELTEEIDLTSVDIPSVAETRFLASELKVDISALNFIKIIPATAQAISKFDFEVRNI